MGENKAIELDPEAQRLFEQFGGLEAFQKGAFSGAESVTQSLLEEQKRHDAVRVLMAQACYLISKYLTDESFAMATDGQEAKVFENLSKVLAKLNEQPGHLGCLLVRFRGTPSDPQIPDKYDYEVIFGHTMVDSIIVPHIVRRNGEKYAKLPDQLQRAFIALADYGVNNLFVRLPGVLDSTLPNLQICLKILSGFRTARQKGTPISIRTQKDPYSVSVINDENLFPDPNLTAVAGLNRFSLKSMEALVEKVDQWVRQHQDASTINRYAGVYNAALELPKISAQIKKPPIELNNVKWLISDIEEPAMPTERMNIAKLAMDLENASPQTVAKMIQSVYGEDYSKINTMRLGERLQLSSKMLNAAEKRAKEPNLAKELVDNLQARLDQVKDHVIDEIHVVEDKGEQRPPGTEAPKEVVHSQIYDMVSFYKGRSSTRKKMVGMVHKPMGFTQRDYEILAKDFHISLEDAEALVRKLKGCFGADGRFKKSAFSEAVELFQKYEQKIFHFLWHHMKDVVLPQDKAAFLNSLQGLTTQMDQPKKAFKILMDDLCNDPAVVQYSDNKAIMLVNLIVHRDKSMTDYDMTPEDVVLSRHNIDATMAQYAAWRIEKDHESFSNKIQTIHKKLIEALKLGHAGEHRLPVALLLNLERELYIFLSMLDSDTSKNILRSAAHEYSDPSAAIYSQKESENCLGALLQNLRVTLRGVGSVGSVSDVPLLEKARANEESFGRLKNDRHFRAQARLITEWVEEAVKLIKFRG
ncbi:MAG: hypothetical protein M0036_02750 [Desulfobacteraceae bacterium]|nr:hypothetical protein [Desulfobacteraceae bacterium]